MRPLATWSSEWEGWAGASTSRQHCSRLPRRCTAPWRGPDAAPRRRRDATARSCLSAFSEQQGGHTSPVRCVVARMSPAASSLRVYEAKRAHVRARAALLCLTASPLQRAYTRRRRAASRTTRRFAGGARYGVGVFARKSARARAAVDSLRLLAALTDSSQPVSRKRAESPPNKVRSDLECAPRSWRAPQRARLAPLRPRPWRTRP